MLATGNINYVSIVIVAIASICIFHAIFSYIIKPSEESLLKNKLHWFAFESVTVTIAIYLLAQLIAVAVITIALGPKFIASDSVIGQFITVFFVEGATLSMLFLFLRRRKANLSELGLKKPKLIDIGYALSGFAAYILIYVVVLQIVQKLIPNINTSQKQDLGFSTHNNGISLVAIFISLVVLPPLVEEIITRGFLYTGLRSKINKVLAALITSALFASAHLQAGSGNKLLWVAAIDTFILSIVLIYLRQKTDRLWASILLHAIKNGIAFVSLFVLHLS